MEDRINKIFLRQFARLKNALEPLALPELALDSISKYFRFTEQDIINLIKENLDYGKEDYNK